MSISRGGDYRERNPVSIGEPDKVTSWPFKEPEKTTAWKDSDLVAQQLNAQPDAETARLQRLAAMGIRDFELEDDEKRTALIKTRMSPPGALGLPELLEAQRLKYGIPDGAFACRAVFDRIHIFPIDLFEETDKIPGTNLARARLSKQKDEQNGHRGILISMGLTAADHCVSHGIELGHVVRTIRNAPHAQECERIGKLQIFYLVMRDGDLTGSETLEEDIRAGRARILDEGGDHSYCHNLEGRKKRSALTRDQW